MISAISTASRSPTLPTSRRGSTPVLAWSGPGCGPALAERVVPVLDVRAAVAAVQTGAAPVGIAYASDVQAVSGVQILLDWPERWAPDIRYTTAIPTTVRSSASAEAFVAFVQDAEREAVWQRFGFRPLDEAGQ